MITIGFLELNSISKGILAADEMIKAADIALIAARPSCPGKYQILITGEVSSVEAALDAGQAASSSNVIDRLILPRIHPQVVEAINMSSAPERLRALGVMEFFSVTAAWLPMLQRRLRMWIFWKSGSEPVSGASPLSP